MIEPEQIFADRNRPYEGEGIRKTHYKGLRGKTEVKGISVRDVGDCLRIALWESCGSPENAEGIYDLDLSKIDPVALEQNLLSNIEKYMGIFPNINPGRN